MVIKLTFYKKRCEKEQLEAEVLEHTYDIPKGNKMPIGATCK
jgi:hypothetical protein